MIRMIANRAAAEALRDQAETCRQLASRAQTPKGAEALAAVSRFFDADAFRTDPASERRS